MKRGWMPLCITLIISAIYFADLRAQADPCGQAIASSTWDETAPDPETAVAIAQCYIRHQDNLQGAYWLEKIVDLPGCKPEYIFHYAQCLKALSLYGKAKFYFQKYAQFDPVVAHQFMQSCDVARIMMEGEKMYALTPLHGNTPNTQLSPLSYQGKLSHSELTASGDPVYHGFDASGLPVESTHLRYAANDLYRVCAANVFRPDERLIPALPGGKLYLSGRNSEGQWDSFKELPLKGMGYTIAFPAISADGSEIYFASNMPGGIGGWDIYKIRNINGTWSDPINLGPVINTPGDEVSPFVTATQLYFSSDWHTGLGGLDVFVAAISGEKYENVQPAGYPVNSPKDDLDFIWDEQSGKAYFVSNRTGGPGSYDLYEATPLFTEVQITVRHEQTMEPVSNAMLVVTPGISRAMFTDNAGIATIRQTFVKGQEIVVRKDGFTDYRIAAPAHGKDAKQVNVYLKPLPVSPVVAAPVHPAPVSSPPVKEEKVKPQEVAVTKTTEPSPTVADKQIEKREAIRTPAVTPPPVERYYIQIAALAKHSDITPFSDLKMYGDLVVHDDAMYSKVRVGTFETDAEARLVLNRLRAGGYPDAFVVKDKVQTQSAQLPQSEYKVRLATYTKAANFDPTPVMHLGSIESYRKDDMTIMLLGGYDSLKSAQQAREEAVSKGFHDAYVVMDNNGVLERVR